MGAFTYVERHEVVHVGLNGLELGLVLECPGNGGHGRLKIGLQQILSAHITIREGLQGSLYHDEDGVHAAIPDGGGDELHHVVLPQMHVHVGRRRQDQLLGIFELHCDTSENSKVEVSSNAQQGSTMLELTLQFKLLMPRDIPPSVA